MKFIKELDGVKDASSKLGIDNLSISACVRGRLRSLTIY